MTQAAAPTSLRKEVSLFGVYTLATGATLSSGFFLLPGIAAAEAGPAVVYAYLLAVVPLLPGIICKIELATAMPRAGGEYYFLDRSLGPMVGTVAGMGTWFSLVLKTAFALVGIGAYMRIFFHDVEMMYLAVAFALALGVLNLFGVGKTTFLQAVLVIGLLLLLVWFIGAGIDKTHHEYFAGFFDKGVNHLVAAAGLVCISYMGMTKVASVAEEVKDPERNLPLGIFLAMATTVAVYAFGTYVMVGVIPPHQLVPIGDQPDLTPVADAARIMVGHGGAVVMSVAALLAFLSVANAGILSASRYPLAMARDRLLPEPLARLNRFQTPHLAIGITVLLVLVSIVLLNPTRIAKLASAFLLLLFAFNCLAVIVMRESRIASYDPGFRCPLYPVLPMVGIVAPFFFIVEMGIFPLAFSVGLILFGVLWFLKYAQRRTERQGAIYHLFARLGTRRFDGLDTELRGILKEKGLRAEDPYDQVIAQAEVIDIPEQVGFEQVVRRAAERLSVRLPVSAEQITNSVMEGTRVGATPVSRGVALPHLRMADLDQPLMVLARVSAGTHVEAQGDAIAHDAEQAIYAVIFLVSPDDDAAQHLRILAEVAQQVDDASFMSRWLDAGDDDQLKRILHRQDRFLTLTLGDTGHTRELIGRPLRELALPDGCLIAIVHRGDQMLIPGGETTLEPGDRLTFVGLPQPIAQLKQRYRD